MFGFRDKFIFCEFLQHCTSHRPYPLLFNYLGNSESHQVLLIGSSILLIILQLSSTSLIICHAMVSFLYESSNRYYKSLINLLEWPNELDPGPSTLPEVKAMIKKKSFGTKKRALNFWIVLCLWEWLGIHLSVPYFGRNSMLANSSWMHIPLQSVCCRPSI